MHSKGLNTECFRLNFQEKPDPTQKNRTCPPYAWEAVMTAMQQQNCSAWLNTEH